jgi:hypothetical protein
MALGDYNTGTDVAAGTTLTGNTALQKEALDQNLRLKMTLDDVFASFQSETIMDTDGIPIPDAIFLNIGAEAPKGANSITMGMVLPLTGDAFAGDYSVPGSERSVSLRSFKMYFGEYANAVAEQTFGRVKNEMDFLGVYEKQTEAFAHWGKEFEGWRIREALLETYDHISVAHTANGLTAHLNSNFYVPKAAASAALTAEGIVDAWGQPVFGGSKGTTTETIADWDDVIKEVLADAVTADATNGAACNLANLRSLSYYAKVIKKIAPLSNGTYVMTIPSNCLKQLKDTTTGQVGELFFQTKQESGDSFSHTWKIGQVDDLVLYSDNRFPIINIDSTLTIDYVKPGNEDDRISGGTIAPYSASNESFSMGFLMGRAAIAKWEVDAPHAETDYSNYGKRKGNGIFGMNGYCAVEFDNDAGWTDGYATTRINEGSMAVAFKNPAL